MQPNGAIDLNAVLASRGDSWPDPRPLPNSLPTVTQFRLAMLPDPFAPWVEDIAERMQAPVEFVAVPAMVAAGAVIGRKVGIRPQEHTDWFEVPNLWGCIVGRPGVMKSPAVQQALAPVRRLQAVARDNYQHECARYDAEEVERELRADARKKLLKERFKSNPGADTSDIATADDLAPKLKRYLANDTSYQSLGELLIDNPNGLLVHRDELLSLLRSLDHEDNVEARGFYLTGWNGTDDYTFDRIGRGTNLYVPSVTVSMIGSTQPGRLRDYAATAIRGGAGDDGLMQRFGLIVWPDISPNWVEHDRQIDPAARNAAFSAFERLDRMTADDVGAEHDPFDDRRRFLRFAPDALQEFRDWREMHEKRIRSNELHPAMESHLSKYRKLIPTLALVHHLVSGHIGAVGVVSVLSALSWGELLESHAQRVYAGAIGAAVDGAREILRRIRKGDVPHRFRARDVYSKDWSGLGDNARVLAALDLLDDHGCLRTLEVPTTSAGGRPTVEYIINPKVLRS